MISGNSLLSIMFTEGQHHNYYHVHATHF